MSLLYADIWLSFETFSIIKRKLNQVKRWKLVAKVLSKIIIDELQKYLGWN